MLEAFWYLVAYKQWSLQISSNVWLKAIGEDVLSLAENKEPIIANPLPQLRTILAPHVFMDDKYLPESTYNLG